jgi:hypothetical protein
VHFGEHGNMMILGTAMNHGRELNGSDLPDWSSIIARVRRPQFWQPSPVSKRMVLFCYINVNCMLSGRLGFHY